jgi:hypothetical protein
MALAWALMVGNPREANSSNSFNIKLDKVVNNVNVAHIVLKTSRAPTVGSKTLNPKPPFLPSHVN